MKRNIGLKVEKGEGGEGSGWTWASAPSGLYLALALYSSI